MFYLIPLIAFLLLTGHGEKPGEPTGVITLIQQELSALYDTEQYKFQIIEKWVPRQLKEIEPAQIHTLNFESSQPKGYQMIRVAFQNGDLIEEVTIQVFVELKRYLPVAATRIMPGEPVTPNLIRMEWVDISRIRGEFLYDTALVKGKSASRLIRKGSLLKLEDFEEQPLIQPGDVVHLKYISNGISVTIPCFAQGSAAQGDNIKLFNKETGEHYIGQVQSAQNVIWEKTL